MSDKKPETSTDSGYLKIREACRYSRLSETTLRRFEAEGRIKFIRPTSRIVLVEKREIDRFLQGQ
jgi:excisionase family DNA binding protein